MLPLQDMNPTRRTPYVTWGLIAVNVLVFVWEMSLSENQLSQAFLDLSVVPQQFSASPFSLESILDGFRSMFFHGGYAHIFGNMLYLYLFGDNIEDTLGKILYLVLYFVAGFVAIGAQVLIEPSSPIPLVGASGAIAGVLGAYLFMFPAVRVRGIIPLGIFSFWTEWQAWAVLGMWFVLQVVNGLASLGANAQFSGGVAFFAHIGGFVAGFVMALVFTRFIQLPPRNERYQVLYQRADKYRF